MPTYFAFDVGHQCDLRSVFSDGLFAGGGQLVGDALQEGDALGGNFAAFGGLFDGAAGFLAVGTVVEAALAEVAAQVGEAGGQFGGVEVAEAEFLQAGGVD